MRPSLVDTLISIAVTVSKRSTCSRRNNGAVIATEKGVVLSTGYNGSLSGMDHCLHDCDCGMQLLIQNANPEESKLWQHALNCPAHESNGCTLAVHAEANSIYFAARNGVSTENAIIYCTTEPCVKCAEAIVQSGIKKVVYSQEYRTQVGINLLQSAGIEVVQA